MGPLAVTSRRSMLAGLLAVPWSAALAGAIQNAGDLLDLHRRMFADADGVEVVWWFLGKMYFAVDGYPEVMARYGDNLMIYRATTLSKDAYAIDWIELNAPRNALTGLPDTRWTNPFTGKSGELRTDKPYGPGRYVFTRQSQGVAVEINQPGVTPLQTKVLVSMHDGRVLLEQDEHKRSTGPTRANIRTIMSITSDRTAAFDATRSAVRSTGVYLSTSDQLPASFAGFPEGSRGQMIVRGLMHKASLDQVIDRAAWDGMKAAHPSWFNGDRLTPRWPSAAK